MKPFSLLCRSCAAKLKVTKLSAVGQRLACPKCGTMIHVQPPEDWQPPEPVSDQESDGLSSFEDIDSVLQKPVVQPAGKKRRKRSKGKSNANQPADQTGDLRREGDAPAELEKAAKSKLPTTSPTKPKSTVATNAAATESPEPVLPSDDWTSDAARRRQKLTLMIAIAAGVVVIVGSIIAAIVINSGNPDPVAQGDPVNQSSDDGTQQDDPKTAPADKPASESDSNDSNMLDETPIVQQPISQEGAIGDAPKVPDVPPGGFSAPGADTNDPPKSDDGSDEPNKVTAPSPFGTTDALNPKPAKPEDIEGIIEPQDQLGGLQSLLDASDTSMQELQDAVSSDVRFAMTKYYLEPVRTKVISLDRRLELEIEKLAYRKPTPFSQAVRTLADLGGFPVTIDARQIALHQKVVDPIEEIKIENQSIQQAFETLGSDRGITALTTETGVILTIKGSTELIDATLDFPRLPDLGLEEKQKFVGAIKGLIQPDVWIAEPSDDAAKISVVNDQIAVKCPETTLLLIRSFIDKLNASFDLIQDPDNVQAKESTISRWQSILPLRDQASTLKPGGARSIHAFLNRVHQESGLSVLVDWHHAVRMDWSPNTMVPGEVSEPTVGELVDELALAMRLVPVAIDAKTMVMTTEPQARSWIDLEVYPISNKLSQQSQGDQLPKLVYDLIGSKVNDHFVRVVFEPKCRCLIVVAPQSIQRQVLAIVGELEN